MDKSYSIINVKLQNISIIINRRKMYSQETRWCNNHNYYIISIKTKMTYFVDSSHVIQKKVELCNAKKWFICNASSDDVQFNYLLYNIYLISIFTEFTQILIIPNVFLFCEYLKLWIFNFWFINLWYLL